MMDLKATHTSRNVVCRNTCSVRLGMVHRHAVGMLRRIQHAVINNDGQ